MMPRSVVRGRKWIGFVFAISTLLGCIRFRNDLPGDAGLDGGGGGSAPDAESDAANVPEGGDVVAPPPPVCNGLPPNVAENIAGDLITEVAVNDCILRRHFANLPPIALIHLQECLTAQIGQVMGCRRADGEPYRYPTEDSRGKLCRDMKSSHAGLGLSDGDFDWFIADLNKAMEQNDVPLDGRTRVVTLFGATRNDIVRLKDAGPTAPCDAPDASAPDAVAPDAKQLRKN